MSRGAVVAGCDDAWVDEVPLPSSKRAINAAGQLALDWYHAVLAGEAALHDPWSPELTRAFVLVADYRQSFAAPLRSVTVGVRRFVERESSLVLVSQRLKRIVTILDKLSRHPSMKLTQMQDIGGCRAIFPGGRSEIEGVLRRMQKNSWDIVRLYDYIEEPKPTGYRAVHVVARRGGRQVEVQLRTEPQHEWASVVERTGGLLRLPRLKDGEGPEDLVRYFQQVALLFALQEEGREPDQGFRDEFAALHGKVEHYWTATE